MRPLEVGEEEEEDPDERSETLSSDLVLVGGGVEAAGVAFASSWTSRDARAASLLLLATPRRWEGADDPTVSPLLRVVDVVVELSLPLCFLLGLE